MGEVQGRVDSWHDDEGWGVLSSDPTPGGCWAHVSSVVAGGRALVVGQVVAFTYEAGEQDGFHFRALEAWPAGGQPDRSHQVCVKGPSDGYRSSLSLHFDEPRGPEA